MRSEHLISSVFRLAGGQFSTLLHGKKGGEKFLPKCVHFHVAKSRLLTMSGLALWITRGVVRWKIIGAMTLGGILFLQLVDPVFFERQGTTAEYEDDGSAMERVDAWDGALYLLRDHPLGAGGGVFKAMSPQYIIEIVRNHDGQKRGVHNTLFQLTSDWGIPGLIVYVGFLGAIFRELGRIRKQA